MSEPSTNGDNGKDNQGRFAAGNKYGRGNPHAKKTARLRSALLSAVKTTDIKAVIQKLLSQAKGGDADAIKELLDRSIGKPIETDLLERMERLEAMLEDIGGKGQL